jgi:hypothetical protein
MAAAKELLDGVADCPSRVDGFLKGDARITAKLNKLFASGKLLSSVRHRPHLGRADDCLLAPRCSDMLVSTAAWWTVNYC